MVVWLLSCGKPVTYSSISYCNLHKICASELLKELSIKVLISCGGTSQDFLHGDDHEYFPF